MCWSIKRAPRCPVPRLRAVGRTRSFPTLASALTLDLRAVAGAAPPRHRADGTVVERCLEFRNRFHLLPYSTATLFVPCGGRPEAVNITNVPALFHADGKPRFLYIVEGANLFFTQQARLYLESRGVIVFKDASANKGGVTSSSLEVLAALAFTDEEFHEHMQVRGADG